MDGQVRAADLQRGCCQAQRFQQARHRAYSKKVAGGVSNGEARAIAKEIFGAEGVPPGAGMLPAPRKGTTTSRVVFAPAIKRVKIFGAYADMLWLETKTPDLKQAQSFAADIHNDLPASGSCTTSVQASTGAPTASRPGP